MKTEPDNDHCLTDDEVGTLAIRLIAQRRELSRGEGRAVQAPDGLFAFADEAMRAHLEQCDVCRMRLLSESRLYRAYLEPIDTSKADKAIRQQIEADLRDALHRWPFKLLFYCREEVCAEEELALAAATEGKSTAPLMFAEREEDGDLILKIERDRATGADSYYLVGSDPAFTKNVELIIDGESYSTDDKGRVLFGEAPPWLADDTIVIVLKRSGQH